MNSLVLDTTLEASVKQFQGALPHDLIRREREVIRPVYHFGSIEHGQSSQEQMENLCFFPLTQASGTWVVPVYLSLT